MKTKRLFLIIFLYFVSQTLLNAQIVNYPLTLDKWTKMNTGSWEVTAEGIKFYGSGYRVWNAIQTNSLPNCINNNVYIKWKANGNGTYMSTGPYVNNGVVNSFFTTGWSYAGSIVVGNDVWYYTRFRVNSNKTWIHITSTSNYDDAGGTVFSSKNGTLTDAEFQSINTNYLVVLSLGDNYGSTGSYAVVSELKYVTPAFLSTNGINNLDFGKILTHQTIDNSLAVTLTNTGGANLTISNLQGISSPYSTNLVIPTTLSYNQSVQLNVTLDRNAPVGVYNNTINIVHNGSNGSIPITLNSTLDEGFYSSGGVTFAYPWFQGKAANGDKVFTIDKDGNMHIKACNIQYAGTYNAADFATNSFIIKNKDQEVKFAFNQTKAYIFGNILENNPSDLPTYTQNNLVIKDASGMVVARFDEATGNIYLKGKLAKVLSVAPTSLSATASSICVGASTTLSINGGELGAAAQWKWYSAACGGTSVNTGLTYNISPVSTQTYYARAEGLCNTTNCASITIAINPMPTTASAGSDKITTTYPVTLAANNPTSGTGQWSIITGTGGILGNASAYNSTFTGTSGVEYTLRWTITSPCGVSTDDVIVQMINIGDNFRGGKVAYFLQSGDPGYISGEIHGLIVATSNLGYWMWCGFPQVTVGASGIAIGTGLGNTNSVLARYGVGDYASSKCKSYTSGGYADWYSPSKDELNKLYLSRVATGISIAAYWSSTEVAAAYPSNAAYYQNFSSGGQSSAYKDTQLSVIAIRSF